MMGRATALLTRALRLDCRSRAIYGLRLALAAITLLSLLTTAHGLASAPGNAFFSGLAFITLLFICLPGLFHFASAITEEKEEEALGLLLLTGLTPLAVLLGKSWSRLFQILLLLAVQFPFTLLAITLGGVSLRQILAVYVTLATFTFLVANLALLASVLCRRSSDAAGLAGAALLLALMAPYPIKAVLGLWTRLQLIVPDAFCWVAAKQAVGAWIAASPFVRLGEILRPGFSGTPWGFQTASSVAGGVVLFAVSWACFMPFARYQKTAVAPRRGTVRRRGLWRLLAPGRPGRWAIEWKDFHFIAGGRLLVLLRLVGLLIYAAILAYTQRRSFDPSNWGLGLLMGIIIMASVEIVLLLSRVYQQEARWRTLTGLVLLPLPLWALAYRKLAGCLVPFVVYAGWAAVGCLAAWPELVKAYDTFTLSYVSAAFIGIAVAQALLFLHLVAFMSVVVRRGGLAAALVAYGAWHLVASSLFSFLVLLSARWLGSTMVSMGVLWHLAVTAVLVGLLHVGVGWRLRRLAAE